MGGNASGWGLYRFNIENNSFDYWNADARELFINTDTGVIKANFAHYNPNSGSYLDDNIRFYRWPKGMSQPEEFQPE